jgi:hypothetical protein
MSDLNAWDSFYVIVGSAAGALIGSPARLSGCRLTTRVSQSYPVKI